MSTEKEWAKKRCPFNVAEYCITSECGAWKTWQAETKSPKYEFKELSEGRNPNSLFSGGWIQDSQRTVETEESRNINGGEWEPDRTEYYTVRNTYVTWKRLRSEGEYEECGTCGRL